MLSTLTKLVKMKFRPVTHVIFDMDGLLLDTESSYGRVIRSIASEYGKEYTLQVRVKVLGTPELESAKIVVRELNLPLSPEEFLTEYKRRAFKELKNPSFMPGASELVQHLHKHNVPIAVATSSSEEAVVVKTEKHQDTFKMFHHMVCGSTDKEVKNGKPAPDIFLVCASRFPDRPNPSKCLVFEDAPNGVNGAVSADMQSVMVPLAEISDELRKPATLVLKSLKDFKPELFGLPPFSMMNECSQI